MVLVSSQVKLYVANVGGIYYANNDNGRRFYNCSNKKSRGTSFCNNQNITLKRINELISAENYRNDLLNVNVIYAQELLALAYKLTNRINANDKEKVEKLKDELKETEERKNRILNMYEMGYINEEKFSDKINPINEQVLKLEKQINCFSKNNEEIIEELCEIGNTIGQLRKEYETMVQQSINTFKKLHSRDEIVKDVKQIIINEDGTVTILYKTFEKYYELKERHRELLDIYIKDDDVDRFLEEIKKNQFENEEKILKKTV